MDNLLLIRKALPALLMVLLTILLNACGGGGGESPDTIVPQTSVNPAGGTYLSQQIVTLTSNEAATICYSTDGSLPSVGGAGTVTGSSPVTVTITEGTTQLKFFSVDTTGNKESVKTETYIIDTTPPNATFSGGTPAPIGLLQDVNVTWQSDESVTYVVELGGNGTLGSGTQVASGSVEANIPVTHSISGKQLSFTEPIDIWLYASDAVGHETSDVDSLTLKPPVTINVNVAVLGTGIVINSTSTRMYVVSNPSSVKVMDIDMTSSNYNSEITSIPVGLEPRGIAITPDESRVYVTNQDSDDISVIDTASNSIIATVASGYDNPIGIAITPDGTRAYFSTWDAMIRVLDIDPNSANYHSVIDNIIMNPLFLFANIAITPDGSKAVVGWRGMTSQGVDVIDIDPASPFYNIPVGHPIPAIPGSLNPVITSPDSLSAYAMTGYDFYRIDLSDYSLPASMPTLPWSTSPQSIAITPDGQALIAGYQHGEERIDIFEPQELTLLGSVPISGSTFEIDITPDGSRAYVSLHDSISTNEEIVMLPLH